MIAITCFNIETCPVSSLLVLELLRPQKASNTNCPIHEIPTPPPSVPEQSTVFDMWKK